MVRIDRVILAGQIGRMKLLEHYRAACGVRRLAERILQTYSRWVEEFLRYHHERRVTGPIQSDK